MKDIKLAILDLYNGEPNQGMRCIIDLVESYQNELSYDIFDVRQHAEIPAIADYDIYIASGGPGNPLMGDGVWEEALYRWMDQVWAHNQIPGADKKYVFFICHSFQMACNHFELGTVNRRKSKSFGTFPVHLTDTGIQDPLFKGLPNPFTAADFRDFQLVQPNMEAIEDMGAEILALEKIRPHVPLERAIMAIRFSPEMIGVQFHPEADAPGMLQHFQAEPRMLHVLNNYGKKKYAQMIKDLSHPEKIELTHDTVIPRFIEQSIRAIKKQGVPV